MNTHRKNIKLKDVCEITSSKRIFSKDYTEEGVPFYRSKEIIEKQAGNNISNELFISREHFNKITSKYGKPENGDLLLTSVGTLGIPYVVKKDDEFYFKDGNLTWFKNFTGLLSRFLYYWFLSPKGIEELRNITIGSTQKALTISNLKDIEINLPPLPEQKAIAAVLSSLDDKIELLREQNKTLEAIAQAIFKEWFVDFNFPDENGNPYKDSGGRMIDSELGEIPEGWTIGKMGEVTKILGGTTPSTKKPEYWNGEIKWTSPKDISITTDIFLIETQKRITKQGLNKISSGLLPIGTLLLSSRAPIGYLAFTGIEVAINQGYIAFLPDQYLDNKFMFLWLKINMNRVINNANGSTFLEISKSVFRQIPLVIPSKESTNYFHGLVGSIFNKIECNTYEIQTLFGIRDKILPKLINGEILLNN